MRRTPVRAAQQPPDRPTQVSIATRALGTRDGNGTLLPRSGQATADASEQGTPHPSARFRKRTHRVAATALTGFRQEEFDATDLPGIPHSENGPDVVHLPAVSPPFYRCRRKYRPQRYARTDSGNSPFSRQSEAWPQAPGRYERNGSRMEARGNKSDVGVRRRRAVKVANDRDDRFGGTHTINTCTPNDMSQ